MSARLSSPAAERKIWLSKFPRANIIRAVRLLPEAVRVGAAAHSVEEEQEERVSSPPAAQRKEPDELKELQEEVQRLTSALRDAERENRDLAARVTLSEKELSKEKERLAAERREMEAAQKSEYESLRAKAAAEGAEEGRKSGREEGIRTAREEIAREYEQKVSSLVALLEKVHSTLTERTEELAALGMPRLIRLWELMLSKMLHREAQVSEGAVFPVLRSLLERLSDRDRILVYLNPKDSEQTAERKDVFGDLLRGVKHLEFIPDANVEKGSCIVETNLGIYDARWQTQLEQIHREIEHLFLEGRKNDDENG